VYNLNFKVSAPFIRDKSNIKYSYLLRDQMSDWSEWQEKPEINFSFLKSGSYTLKVKAQSLSGESAQTAQINFSIATGWYASWPWTVLWILIFTGLVTFAIRQMKIIIVKEKEKTRLEEQKLQELRDVERENKLMHQEKERIEADSVEKSKDLANNAVLIARKRELLIEIQEKLNDIRKNAKNDYTRTGILNIVRNIEINLNDEQQYQLFDTNLERVHQELFDELKARYPNITNKELRLCAFINMELTNNEMASFFNISVRGVETARYRLRKKYPDIDDLLGSEEESIG
jgi:AraC family chitin signaling transcriptional activator